MEKICFIYINLIQVHMTKKASLQGTLHDPEPENKTVNSSGLSGAGTNDVPNSQKETAGEKK